MTKTISKLAIGLMLAWPILTGLTLPSRGPQPTQRPAATTPAPDAKPEAPAESGKPADTAEVPTPDPKPEPPTDDKTGDEDGKENRENTEGATPTPPAAAPAPAPAPDAASDKGPAKQEPADENKGAKEPEEKAEPVDPPPPPEDPKMLAACLADLKAIGASFETKPRVDDAGGCGMASPIVLKKPLPDVTLEPEATIRCETALQLARMTRDMLKPAAEAAFPGKPALSGIRQASGYVCRNRNSAETGKISEHAYGNAIDIAALRFGDEEEPVMIAKQDDGSAQAVFQRAFNAIACLYFTTVLSPGSDPTHQDHMHLDVIERKSGLHYCR
ncbi:extensin family protein [Rhizobium sp. AG855]|uniref:extensin-like domain-containing protein n=1 Tax=Rhizobium sp. AG855 TaxID=2183898 RepID=UPI000FF648D4|nr:extensin family protein [Rhizobium sp. AG855]RKE84075.1 hypothetical protein DFO46_0836 [Rhizobium sp. AG855]